MPSRRKKPSSRPGFGRPLAILALAFLAAAALLEIGTRILIWQEALVYQDSADPRLRFELRPGAQGYKSGSWVRINSLGLRQPELAPVKGPHEFRLLVVGDHPSFALGLPEDVGYVQQISRYFQWPKNATFTVVNLSMYNYNIIQKLEAFKRRALPLDADAVVLQVGPDDFGRHPSPWLNQPRLKNFLREHSHFYRWATEQLFTRRAALSMNSGKPAPPGTVLRYLADFKKSCRLPMMLAYFPDLSKGETWESPSPIEKRYQKDARKLGLPFVNVALAFRHHAASVLLIDPRKPYLGALGQSLAAKAVTPGIFAMARRRSPALRQPRRRYPQLLPPERQN
jgi:hypothetical protein